MYVPAAFREERPQVLAEFIRHFSFGTLISLLEGELFATHIPFLLDASRGTNGTLRGHVARPNPHWRAFDSSSGQSLAVFQGAHAYISPRWYAAEQAVPTWNYMAVHAYGTPTILADVTAVRALLSETVRTFEEPGATPWTMAHLSDDYLSSMIRGIVAFEMPIARIEGKRKMSQNRPASDRAGAIAGLEARGDPLSQAVAELMAEA
jgi:transcriptional regulator